MCSKRIYIWYPEDSDDRGAWVQISRKDRRTCISDSGHRIFFEICNTIVTHCAQFFHTETCRKLKDTCDCYDPNAYTFGIVCNSCSHLQGFLPYYCASDSNRKIFIVFGIAVHGAEIWPTLLVYKYESETIRMQYDPKAAQCNYTTAIEWIRNKQGLSSLVQHYHAILPQCDGEQRLNNILSILTD